MVSEEIEFIYEKIVVSNSYGGDSRNLERYLRLVSVAHGTGHVHHILPKSLFPEFSNLEENPWNAVVCTPRFHFLLHVVLAKVFSETFHMGTALFYMSNGGKDSAIARKLYGKTRVKYNHSEETKRLISERTKQKFRENPEIKKKLIEKIRGLKRSDQFCKFQSKRMTENNPMKRQDLRDKMRGDKNVSRRDEVRKKISDKNQLKGCDPWDHFKQTDKTLSIWAMSDRIYEFCSKSDDVPTCSEIRKFFNIENGTTLYNMRLKLLGGWNPSLDKNWVNKFKTHPPKTILKTRRLW